jgi:hypothetical protein
MKNIIILNQMKLVINMLFKELNKGNIYEDFVLNVSIINIAIILKQKYF